MPALHLRIVAALVLFCVAAPAADEDGIKRHGMGEKVPYRVPYASSTIVLDGVLDEQAWADALALSIDFEVRPGENVPAPVKTDVLLTYNRETFYAAFRCYDPDPEAVRARVRDHDELGGDDWVALILDTFNDERRTYDYIVNPMGVMYDGIETPTNEDTSWDAIWNCSTKFYDWGWAVEIAIPFSQMRFQRKDGPQIWGFDAVRRYPRSVPHHLGAFPRDRSNNCYMCQSLKIEGFEGASPGRNIEIIPTITAARTESRDELPDGEMSKESQDAEFGLTARWGITPNMMMNFTANPDFSQVEADARQLDINQPFALSYDEKRPFFTEGADLFDTNLSIVYTRTMRDPNWGLKLTGKEGSNTIGAYAVRDDLTNLIFPGSQSSSSDTMFVENTSSVFRYKRDFGSKYTVGAIATDREAGDYFNRVAGVDGILRVTSRDRIRFLAAGSSTQYPYEVALENDQDTDSFGGRTLYLNYYHGTRSHDWYFGYKDISDGFRADLGFLPQVGYKMYNAGWGHTWNAPAGAWWSMFNVGTGYDHYDDQDGNLLDHDWSYWINFSGTMQSYIDIVGGRRKEGYNGEEFTQNYFTFYSSMRPNGNTAMGLNFKVGDRVDYANTQPGERLNLYPFFSLALGRHLRMTYYHTFERMTVEQGRLYTANISDAEIMYQFSTRMFVRAILQYVDYRYVAENYIDEIDPEYRHLFSQFLFSYKINPQTVLFLGYSDNYFGAQEYGLTQSDRTFFVKIGYAWAL